MNTFKGIKFNRTDHIHLYAEDFSKVLNSFIFKVMRDHPGLSPRLASIYAFSQCLSFMHPNKNEGFPVHVFVLHNKKSLLGVKRFNRAVQRDTKRILKKLGKYYLYKNKQEWENADEHL